MKNFSCLPMLLALSTSLGACAVEDEPTDTSETAQDATLSSAYSAIRAQEANFPLPTPVADALIGTFDAWSNTYSGLQSTYDYIIDPTTGKPKQMRVIPSTSVNAVHATLRFNITNRGSNAVSLTANGVTVTAPAGQSYVSVDVGSAATVNWTLRVGTWSKSDIVKITHPYTVGAGVYTVAALPVSIVYEPPQGGGSNSATYTLMHSIANTLTLTVQDDNATTADATPAAYDDVAQIETAMGNLQSVLSAAPNVPAKSTVIAALGAVESALGSVSAQQTNGMSTTTESALTVSDTWQGSFTTDLHLGPGQGDRIIYLTNARVVWLADRDKLSVALLGFDGHRADGIPTLQADLAAINAGAKTGPTTGLPGDSLRALLALDPFVAGGPNAALDPTRFVPADAPYSWVSGTGGIDSYQVAHAVQTADRSASKNFSTLITDERAGWLSFLGIGVTDTATITSTTTHSASQDLVVTDTVTSTLNVQNAYSIDVFYDRVFGSFAFKQHP